MSAAAKSSTISVVNTPLRDLNSCSKSIALLSVNKQTFQSAEAGRLGILKSLPSPPPRGRGGKSIALSQIAVPVELVNLSCGDSDIEDNLSKLFCVAHIGVNLILLR